MTPETLFRTIPTLLIATLISGCASIQQANQFNSFETQLQEGQFQEAEEAAIKQAEIDSETGDPTDLLWTLQSGTLLRINKNYDRSNFFFDKSEELIKEEDTRDLGSEAAIGAGSMVVNDTVMPYQPSYFEGVMANTYKALNFSAIDDRQNARIEWNRVDDRQRRAVDAFSDQITKQKQALEKDENAHIAESLSASGDVLAQQGIDMSAWKPYQGFVNPFSTYMHGLFFLLNAESSSDFNRAYESFRRAYSMTENSVVRSDMEMARQLMNGTDYRKVEPGVWVIYESGLAPKLEELRIDLPIVLTNRDVVYTGIALPKLVERNRAFASIEANGVATELLSDMDQIVKAEFSQGFNHILVKELVRATAKTIAQRDLTKQDPYAGLAAVMLQIATTSADIRSWSALPKEFQVTRINRPQDGVVTLSAPGVAEELSVQVDKSSRFNIIYVKAINDSQMPSVEVISI